MLIAHGSGIDEILVTAIPVAVIAGLLVIADRRAKRSLRHEKAPPSSSGPGEDRPDPVR